MSDVVFILGAGASKECGAPLMADFLDVATQLWRSGSVEDKKEHFEKVFRAIGGLQSVHSKAQLNLTNIESVFTALEIAKVLGKLPNFDAKDIPGVIASLKEVIVKTLESTIKFPITESRIYAPVLYKDFADLLSYLRNDAFPRQSVSVITFNYDILVDIALSKKGLGPNYGIPPDSKCSDLVSLYKLHGSLNWAQLKRTRNICPLQLDQYLRKRSFVSFDNGLYPIPIGSQLSEYFSDEVEPEPVIVPPSWNKSDYHQALSIIWGKAAQDLSDARAIFICGYSLPETDAFFRLLYALGTVGPAPLEKIIVYNPVEKGGPVDERFYKMLGPGARDRYQYEDIKFSEAIFHIKELFPKRP